MRRQIAIISDAYDKLKDKERAEFLQGRAITINEYQHLIELTSCSWVTTPTWLHVLKVADSSGLQLQKKWAGRLRRITDKVSLIVTHRTVVAT